MSQKKKPHINLVVIGHVDHGKSTTMGHFLYLLSKMGKYKAVDERKFKEIEEYAKQIGKESFKYAWILDKLKEERERGLTIDLAYLKFETDRYFFTLIDAPGHRDFIKNMITGTSQADAAILFVSAKPGEFEAGMKGQTVEHALLAKTMGVDQLIVAVNKMDVTHPPWSRERYEEIKAKLGAFLAKLGYNVKKIPFVPVSGWTGDNLVEKSPKMPWYDGPTLYQALDSLEPPRRLEKLREKPLRIPVQDVYSITGVGTVPVGRVESGVLKVGDKVVFMPPGVVGEVKSIETHHVRIPEAVPGDNIGFNVKGVSRRDIRRGDVAGHLTNPPTVAEEFTARIFVLYHPTAIGQGYTPVVHIHTATVACRFIELVKKLDPRTGQAIQEHPPYLKTGDAAIVRLKPIKPVVVEKFSEFPALGRFAVRDSGRTIAAGIVVEVKPAKVEVRGK